MNTVINTVIHQVQLVIDNDEKECNIFFIFSYQSLNYLAIVSEKVLQLQLH